MTWTGDEVSLYCEGHSESTSCGARTVAVCMFWERDFSAWETARLISLCRTCLAQERLIDGFWLRAGSWSCFLPLLRPDEATQEQIICVEIMCHAFASIATPTTAR